MILFNSKKSTMETFQIAKIASGPGPEKEKSDRFHYYALQNNIHLDILFPGDGFSDNRAFDSLALSCKGERFERDIIEKAHRKGLKVYACIPRAMNLELRWADNKYLSFSY